MRYLALALLLEEAVNATKIYEDGSDSNNNIILRIPVEKYKSFLTRAKERLG